MSAKAAWSMPWSGYERAIVFDAPGTTRDTVTAITALAGWPVELCDTAGLPAPDPGADRKRSHAYCAGSPPGRPADALLLVFNSQVPWQATWRQLLEARWPAAIVVYSKCDLGEVPKDREAARHRDPCRHPHRVSTNWSVRSSSDWCPRSRPVGPSVPFAGQQRLLLEAIGWRRSTFIVKLSHAALRGARPFYGFRRAS